MATGAAEYAQGVPRRRQRRSRGKHHLHSIRAYSHREKANGP